MRMFFRFTLLAFFTLFPNPNFGLVYDNVGDLECSSGEEYNSTLAAYYPDITMNNEDMNGNCLESLQAFLDGRSKFVTVALDSDLQIPYGTRVCIESINRNYNRNINFEVRDTGENLRGAGFNRIDIRVRSEEDSYDKIVNREAKIVLQL